MDQNEDILKQRIEETMDYMSFSCKSDTKCTGSMGFSLHSDSGKDYSFVMYIEETEDGKKAHGRFEDPEHADVFVIMHAEDFVKVYSGEVGVSAISRMVFRGRISVRNYDLNGVNRFMGSFEFSSQKWDDYYAYCDRIKEEKQREENRFFHLVHPIAYSKPLASIRSWVQNPFFASLYLDPKCLPSLDSLKLNGMNLSPKPALPTVYSTLSLPSLDPVPDDDGLDATQPEMQSETQQRSAVDLFDEQSGEKAMLSPVHDDTEELANHTNDGELPHFGFHSLPFCRTILRALNSPDPETMGEYPKQAIPCSNSTLMGRIETVLNSTRSNSQDVFEDSETAIFNDEAPLDIFRNINQYMANEPRAFLEKMAWWPFRRHDPMQKWARGRSLSL